MWWTQVDTGDVWDAQDVLDVWDAIKGSLRVQERSMVGL